MLCCLIFQSKLAVQNISLLGKNIRVCRQISTKLSFLDCILTMNVEKLVKMIKQKDSCADIKKAMNSHHNNFELVNQTSSDGFQPLFHAAYRGDVDICKLLLDRGANLMATVEFFRPVHFACAQSHQAVIELFEKYGDKIDQKNVKGIAAISMARKSSELNINIKSSTAKAPSGVISEEEKVRNLWFRCAEDGNLGKMQQILETEAMFDINCTAQRGKHQNKTALQIASQSKNYNMALWLAQHGGAYYPVAKKESKLEAPTPITGVSVESKSQVVPDSLLGKIELPVVNADDAAITLMDKVFSTRTNKHEQQIVTDAVTIILDAVKLDFVSNCR